MRIPAPTDPRAESGRSAAAALEVAAAEFAGLGIRIERVLTDNAFAYTLSSPYRAALGRVGARHKRTRPRRRQTKGKAERLIQTLLREWAYGRAYRSNQDRYDALTPFVDFYNRQPPHTALGGRSPIEAVNNLMRDHN